MGTYKNDEIQYECSVVLYPDGRLEDTSVERPGIRLMLTIMNSMVYKRVNGRNRFTMTTVLRS